MSEIYPLGKFHKVPAIPPIPQHCITVEAGPIRFVVESRQLTAHLAAQGGDAIAAIAAQYEDGAIDDYGASLHVYGAEDNLEYLRFDCFANEPHYHYMRNSEDGQVVCRFDDIAEGDSIAWTVRCIRNRLPEMLAFAGVPELGETVRLKYAEVLGVVDQVESMLSAADQKSITMHGQI
ncbi:MAG TPA: hypothetical protein VND89_10180 [Acidimicrobiales bacterium]|nr:hypothetical protein [Acidimicrobiales bacterium]